LTSSTAPQLEGDARAAVLHRGSHLQIIASAGSGKTEVVAQRFALHLRDLTGRVFTRSRRSWKNLEVVENELIPLQHLDDPFKGMAEKFYELLEQFRLLTYGQLISRAVAELRQARRRQAGSRLRASGTRAVPVRRRSALPNPGSASMRSSSSTRRGAASSYGLKSKADARQGSWSRQRPTRDRSAPPDPGSQGTPASLDRALQDGG
jgi:hypothetical protein